MKRILAIVGFSAISVVIFLGGVAAGVYYVASPIIEQQQSFQQRVYYKQVVALKRLKEGDPQPAQAVLQTLSIYGLLFLAGTEAQAEKTMSNRELHEATEYVCANSLSQVDQDKDLADFRFLAPFLKDMCGSLKAQSQETPR